MEEQIDQILDATADSFVRQLRSPILHTPSEQGLEYEEVTVPALDGVALEGWFIPADGSGKLIFGPVVTVTTFETEEEAIAITNASEYGLFAGVYTRDSERALRVARRIDVGVVLINNYFRGILGLPFGGTKHSGYGREHTIETLAHFGYRKLIRFPSGA